VGVCAVFVRVKDGNSVGAVCVECVCSVCVCSMCVCRVRAGGVQCVCSVCVCQSLQVMNMVMTSMNITSDQRSQKAFVIIILVTNLTGYVRDHYLGNTI
jgi:hypothetical protein